MTNSPEIKCELMDPSEAGRIGTLIKSELQSRNYTDLVKALADIPCTVVRLEGVPIVSALALIGYNSSEITDITPTKDPDGNTEVNFKTPEDNSTSFHRLKIPHSTDVMFFSDGYGRFGFRDRIVGLSRVTGKATPDFEAIPAIMTQSTIEEQRENLSEFFSCHDCVVVSISPTVRKTLFEKRVGLPGLTFAFVQGATPLPL